MQDDGSHASKGTTTPLHGNTPCTMELDYSGTTNVFLVIVDAFSKSPEVRDVSSKTTQRTIEVLQDVDLFATHSFPRYNLCLTIIHNSQQKS